MSLAIIIHRKNEEKKFEKTFQKLKKGSLFYVQKFIFLNF